MNRHTSIALLGAVVAVTAGMLSVNAFSATPFLVAQSASVTQENYPMLGHVTYVVKDSNGSVKRYIQGDNLVVNKGESCVAQVMFKSNATDACDPNQSTGGGTSLTNGFNWIAIGNGTIAVNATSGTFSVLPTGGTGGGEKQRLQDLADITASPGSGAIAVMSKTFSFSAGTATTIKNSGLFDSSSTSTANMFSAQDISVPVGAADTLTVTWTITLGS